MCISVKYKNLRFTQISGWGSNPLDTLGHVTVDSHTQNVTCWKGYVHSPSMKTERLYFLFLSKNEVRHLCNDSAIFCPKHVSMIHNWKDLQIYTQFLLLQRLDHEVKKQKSRGHSQV